MKAFLWVVALLTSLGLQTAYAAPQTFLDADGQRLSLNVPAQRIITLAPHLTEILLELGAKKQIIAVGDDHEERGLHPLSRSGYPVISDAVTINYERLRAAQPDLVLAWGEGTPKSWISQLRHWGIPVFVVGTKKLDDVVTQVELLGKMTGHEKAAMQQAATLRQQLALLGSMSRKGPRLHYFLQIWRQPLYSLQADHLLSQALARCGADNILPASKIAAPLVNPEFVLKANPDVIMVPGEDALASQQFWQRFPQLTAVKNKRWMVMDDSRLTRPGPSMILAVQPVCQKLQNWR